MSAVDEGAEAWKRRHARTVKELKAARRENQLLREALDGLNADIEEVLSNASQGGIESAKSSLIKLQRGTIWGMRARLRAAGIDPRVDPRAVADV